MNLEAMGYAELARVGHTGHQAHIAEPVPEFEPRDHPVTDLPVTLEALTTESFWVDPRNVSRWNQAWNESSNPNGYWVAFGHLFKVLYSYQRIIEHVKDEEQARLCSLILLERYMNPAVQGG